jgi:undecaprenyl-diphosphatase
MWIGGLALAILALWGFAEIAEEVLEQETQAIDTSILQTLQSLHNPVLDRVAIAVTFLGEPRLLTFVSVVFGIILLRQRHWASTITLAIVAAGGIGLNFLLKDLFARARPELWQRIVDVNYYSFPSGHAMISMVIYGFIGYWLASRYRRWRSFIAIATIVLIAAIGLSRLYLGVHWPTDVVAGYAAGLVWVLVCILSLDIMRKINSRSLARPSSKS